jgi:hypothetical protein
MTLLEHALAYANLGWSLVPCPLQTKYPAIAWKIYQETKADTAQLKLWFREPFTNIALVTGEISGVIVLDIDGALDKTVPITPTVRTGSGGLHLYFRHPGFRTKNWVAKLPGIDFRGDGGLVVLPPSKHPNGTYYTWLTSPFGTPLATAPTWLLAMITPMQEAAPRSLSCPGPIDGDGSAYGKAALRRAISEVTTAPEHTRNDMLNNKAFALGRLVGGGELAYDVAESQLTEAAIVSGLTSREIRATIRSGLAAGAQQPKTAPPRRHRA